MLFRRGRGIIDESPEELGAAEEGETTGLLQEDRPAKQPENIDARSLVVAICVGLETKCL